MNEHWFIVDSSKLKDYLDCPRKYFFRHIWGWEIDRPNIHLIFGEAYHKLMERLLIDGYTPAAIDLGMDEFNQVYRQHFAQNSDPDRAPKNPAYAELAAINYITKYKYDLLKYEVLHTEVSGSVPVCWGEDRKICRLHFKMDSILRNKETGEIFSLEHKTTSRGLGPWYLNEFLLGIQVGTYTHVMRTFYPEQPIYGVVINAVSLLKTKMNFERFPIRKTPQMLQSWLDVVDDALFRIEADLAGYVDEAEEPGLTMQSFLQNPQSCDRWYGCPYLDFCYAWDNPLSHWQLGDQAPNDFIINYWDPRQQVARERIEL